MIKRIKNKFLNLKYKIKEYFLLKNSLDHLANFIKKFYILSVGFDDIYYGIKNHKRLKICIFNCAVIWLATFYFLSYLLSDFMFSLMDISSFTSQLKLLGVLAVSITFLIAVLKTDLILAQINKNLSPFKIVYYLMKDLKQKHKLNDKNYKKLAILSRMTQLILMDCGTTLILVVVMLFVIKMAILSGKFYWISATIILTPIFIIIATTATSTICLIIILFTYYSMIFGQINVQIKLILNGKSVLFDKKDFIKIVGQRKEIKLIQMIYQHNLVAIEIQKINSMFGKSLASLFVNFSIIKIISLYLLVNFNEFFIQLFLITLILITLVFGYGITYLFTLQIKSAHKSLNIFHSIVCKYRIRLSTRLKVS